jgi:hypothetical protein
VIMGPVTELAAVLADIRVLASNTVLANTLLGA